jgi:hypothetical protein
MAKKMIYEGSSADKKADAKMQAKMDAKKKVPAKPKKGK